MNAATREYLDKVQSLDPETVWRHSAPLHDNETNNVEMGLFSPINERLQRLIIRHFGAKVTRRYGDYGNELTLLLVGEHPPDGGTVTLHICFRRREGVSVR